MAHVVDLTNQLVFELLYFGRYAVGSTFSVPPCSNFRGNRMPGSDTAGRGELPRVLVCVLGSKFGGVMAKLGILKHGPFALFD